MPILKNIGMLSSGRTAGPQEQVYSIPDAALVWSDKTIAWVGAECDLPKQFASEKTIDAQRYLVVPGLIDCHTHLAFGGWRCDEFVQRCLGKSYSDIALAGGGILSTVRATRECSKEQLHERCVGFLKQISALGVTTLEAKSGYGLDLASEIKILEVYRELQKRSDISIVPTLLAAHAVPNEYKSQREKYVALILDELLPRVAAQQLAVFCDVFVDTVAFSIEEARTILQAAGKLGLRAKLHVDQLADTGGATLAAQLGAISADHLEFISDAGIEALKTSQVVAVSLPLASLFTRQAPLDARRLLARGVPVAVATDFNPGSAPSFNLHLAMMLACTMNRMSPQEVLNAATIVAARALGLHDEIGSLEVGKRADFAVFDAPSVDQWLYHFGSNACRATFKNGSMVYGAL
ncbi:MAG: imidazolonepropionase [Deltaproteobacteria bacterium]|nr:imidazolonepropionase [Deltaproteobacteria bacterium]